MFLRTWIRLLEPDIALDGTVLDLTPQLLTEKSIEGVIFDVDDTIVSTRTAEVSEEVLTWMQDVKPIVKVYLVSNNLKRGRIRRIANSLELPYFFGAGKPSRRSLRKALQQMNLEPHQVAMVGDRLFTDVLAGNRLGMLSILVKPIMDAPQARFKKSGLLRAFEIWLSKRLGASVY